MNNKSIVDNPIFGEMGNELRRVLSDISFTYAMSDTMLESHDGKSSDGYISFCDGYIEASVYMSFEAASYFLAAKFPESPASDEADFFAAQDYRDFVEEQAEEANVKFEYLYAMSYKNDYEKFYKLTDKLKRRIEKKTGKGLYFEPGNGDSNFVKLTLGVNLKNSDEDSPFYTYLSINFDAPYFRSNSEQKRNGAKDGSDFVLCDFYSSEPENINEFRTVLNDAIGDKFGNCLCKTNMEL